MTDNRIAYGARCTWWDSVQKVGKMLIGGHPLPCCPHCGGVLFECESEDKWLASADRYEALGNPGYRAMLEWGRGKCFKAFADLKDAYDAR